MFAEQRPLSDLSSPETWANKFRDNRRLSWLRGMAFARDLRWTLIRTWVPSGRILDGGCGAGEWCAFLQQHGYAAFGLDYSAELIARNRALYATVDWRTGDIEALPYCDASFCGVISWGVIEHREHGPQPALREFARVLAPGGVAIVTVPNDAPAVRRAELVGRADDGEDVPRQFYQYYMTEGELEDHLRAAGLAPMASGTLPIASLALLAPRFYGRWGSTVIGRVLQALVRLCLSWSVRYRGMIYCVAQKAS